MGTNNTITMDDLLTIFTATARQMNTPMFMSLIGTTIDAHCDKHDIKNLDFVDELRECMVTVNAIIESMDGDK